MKNISEIDKNFAINSNVQRDDISFHNILSSPFDIRGVFYENGLFRRMPEEIAKTVSDGVYALHTNTAGGRVRFATNSPYVAIVTRMPGVGKMSHFALSGSAGFDLYADNRYVSSYIPPFDISDGYQGIINLGSSKMREITINFPLYSNVSEVYIGLSKNSELKPPAPYKTDVPVVYYGSSVTQGGCASRPGTSYQSIVSRQIDADFINLGFSGNAHAEDEMRDYIKTLKMSVFVFDYDYNAPTPEYLDATHEKMFAEIRRCNPSLPIILMTRPKYYLNKEDVACYKIIEKTYKNAIVRGDKNVYLIPGKKLMRLAKNEGTVDACHPTDLGFYSMAHALIPVLKEII